MVTRGWGKDKWGVNCLTGYRVLVWDDKKVLEIVWNNLKNTHEKITSFLDFKKKKEAKLLASFPLFLFFSAFDN